MPRTARDLCDDVRFLLANTPQSAIPDETILAHAAAVLDELAARERPHELTRWGAFVPDSNGIVALPTDIVRVLEAFFDGRKLREVALMDVVEATASGVNEPRYWCMLEPESAPPYRQRLQVLGWEGGSDNVTVTYTRSHPPLALSPSPSPVLLGPGWWATITERVAQRVILGPTLGTVTAQLQQAAMTDARLGDVYARASRSIGEGRPGRVGGAFIPRRRRSQW